MALTVWDPFSALARLDRQFDDIVRRTWSGRSDGRRVGTGYVPAADITTDGDDVVVSLELPGVDVEKDVEVDVTKGRLTISGHREDRSRSENGQVLISEHRYGAFRREFALPDSVDPDRVEASYEQGVLKVRVPGVTRPAVESRRVEVRRADSPQAVETDPAS